MAFKYEYVSTYIMQIFFYLRWVQIACPRLSIDWGEYFDK
jgi:diphthamide synthase subunit DPH2